MSTDTSEQGKQNEKPANYTIWGGETQKRKTSCMFLPLGGGKLRCRDVLGLMTSRGSSLNPEGWGELGVEEKMNQRELGGQASCSKSAL